MLILDLRWLLFGILLSLAAVLLMGSRLDRWTRPRRAGSALESILEPVLFELGPALDQAPFGMLLIAGRRACRYANPFACRLLGLTRQAQELPETAWTRLLDADRAAVRQEKSAPGRYRSVTIAAAHSDGSDALAHAVRWWVSPLGDLDLVFLLDVTAQHQAEESSRSLINDLSHELRTPLATILTHLEVLGLPSISPEIREQSIVLLKAEARRMSRLANLMLEIGRLEASAEIERREVDLLTLVEEAVAQVAAQAEERDISVSVEADSPLPAAIGDRDRLRQVFLNLLDNAVKYSRPGSRAMVSLRLEEAGIRCAVRDTGPGIPSRHLPNVTRRFYRAAPQEAEGSGLGLALVEEILRRHESDLEIESYAEGEKKGTCVRFLLPTADSRPRPRGEKVSTRW